MSRVKKENIMNNRIILCIFLFINICVGIRSHENPASVRQWNKTFSSVVGSEQTPKDIESEVIHDIELFRKVIQGNRSGSLGDYYLGLLKWIEEHGDQKYLPFLEELLDEYAEPFPDKDETSPYFTEYDRGDLFEVASNVWFKIKSKGKNEEEIARMIIESLKKDSDVPKLTRKVWEEYHSVLKEKRNNIYEVLKNENIKKQYDIIFSRGRFQLYDLFKMGGLSPNNNEIKTFLNLQERILNNQE